MAEQGHPGSPLGIAMALPKGYAHVRQRAVGQRREICDASWADLKRDSPKGVPESCACGFGCDRGKRRMELPSQNSISLTGGVLFAGQQVRPCAAPGVQSEEFHYGTL